MPYSDDLLDDDPIDFDASAKRLADQAASPRWSPIAHPRPGTPPPRPSLSADDQYRNCCNALVAEPDAAAGDHEHLDPEVGETGSLEGSSSDAPLPAAQGSPGEFPKENEQAAEDGGDMGELLRDPAAVSAPGPAPTDGRRDSRGRFGRGNKAAVLHGFYAAHTREQMVRERTALEQQSILDDGGLADMPARRRMLHRHSARLHVQAAALGASLEQHGLFARDGRLRLAWLQKLESLITTALKVDAQLGLERQPRHVGAGGALDARAVLAGRDGAR